MQYQKFHGKQPFTKRILKISTIKYFCKYYEYVMTFSKDSFINDLDEFKKYLKSVLSLLKNPIWAQESHRVEFFSIKISKWKELGNCNEKYKEYK